MRPHKTGCLSGVALRRVLECNTSTSKRGTLRMLIALCVWRNMQNIFTFFDLMIHVLICHEKCTYFILLFYKIEKGKRKILQSRTTVQ